MNRIAIYALTLLLCVIQGIFSQTQIEKIKFKHLKGTWYSKDVLVDVKTQPALTLHKKGNASAQPDSCLTICKIYKGGMTAFWKRTISDAFDTLYVDCFFIEKSKNLKVTQKVYTGQKLTVNYDPASHKESETYQSYLIKTTTYHVEFISEDKLVLKYINY